MGKGRPKLTIRLHPKALQQLQRVAEAADPGQKGGAAAYARRLIYEHLGFDSGEMRSG
ncbi:MAG: hypothetical protein AB7S38_08580 [Vulcanimicrobiota bacterium]